MNKQYNHTVVEHLVAELDIKIQWVAPYHARLTHDDGRRLDYFPKSGKATWVSSQEWFQIPDIEQFILKNFV